MNSVESSTKNLSLKKQPFYPKDKKNEIINSLVKEMLSDTTATPEVKGRCKEIYRFSPKISGKRLELQFELFYEEANFVGAILRNGEARYVLDALNAQRINKLLIGTKEDRQSEKPTFLFPLLNGNRFEYIRLAKLQALSSNYFNQWDEEKEIYRKRIYPLCLEIMAKLLPDNAMIVELCGGDGEFAKMAFQTDNLKDKIFRYYLFDTNRTSLLKAERQLRDELCARFFVIDEDISSIDYEKRMKGEKVDLIFGLGALTEQVLPSRESALKALEIASRALKPGGFFLLTGLTSCWVNAEDLKNQGFKVLNSSAPTFFRPEDPSPEFYIAEKIEKSENTSSSLEYFVQPVKRQMSLWSH